MFAIKVKAKIHPDKYVEFIHLITRFSPAKPIGIFQLYENSEDRRLLNKCAECSNLEPLTEYIQTQHFKDLVSVINDLGSLEGIKMEKYSESCLNSLYTINENEGSKV